MPVSLWLWRLEIQSVIGSDLAEHPRDALARCNLEDGDTREIVEPESNELFIDIDSESDVGVMSEMVRILRFNGVVVSVERVTPSRTEGHYHAVVKLDRDVSAVERIAFQACLGSDRKRELLSLLRVVLELDRPPTVFFEPKTEEVSSVENDDDIPF